MPATYSISVGLPTEASRKPTITSVLLDLPDNTQKLISPKDVRDAFLSTWANAAFKQTIGLSSIEYIGIDSGNPENRDIKQKIFLGKRNYAGVDIMNNNLLSPTNLTDIYLFNTKDDTATQSSTKVAFLAGTNSSLYPDAPFIESKLSSSGVALDLDIVNPSIYSGPINIVSQTGRVSLNGIVFPTLAETSASASNGKILKYSGSYPSGSLKWSDPSISISSFGVPGTPTNIYGSPSNVNGYSLEFVDDAAVAAAIGGIPIGMSFSAFSFYNGSTYQNWPIVEVLRKILYPYVPPVLTLEASSPNNMYAEIGVTTSIVFTYSITKYSDNIDDYQIVGPDNSHPGYPIGPVGTYSGLAFSGLPGDKITVTFSADIYKQYDAPGVVTPVTNDYVLQVSDSGFAFYTHSSTASITFLSPVYTSFNTTKYLFIGRGGAIQVTTLILSSTKNLIPYPSIGQSFNFNYNGAGYIYFAYPVAYGTVTKIKDPNGYIIHDSSYLTASTFTSSVVITPSATGLPPGGQGPYIVYRSIGTCSYFGIGNFEFTFN